MGATLRSQLRQGDVVQSPHAGDTGAAAGRLACGGSRSADRRCGRPVQHGRGVGGSETAGELHGATAAVPEEPRLSRTGPQASRKHTDEASSGATGCATAHTAGRNVDVFVENVWILH